MSAHRFISVRTTFKLPFLDASNPFEKTIKVNYEQLREVRDKRTFIDALILNGLFIPIDISNVKLTRKSKKNKSYIQLEDEKDFKSLARSLKVKNHIKLIISDVANESEEDVKAPEPRRKPMDFARLGDALIDVAIDHFKDFLFDFKVQGSTFLDPSSTSEPNRKSEREPEKETSAPDEINETIHSNVCCDRCQPDTFVPMRGTRYSCLVCPDFDLCESCERELHESKTSFGSHVSDHPMAKLYSEVPYFNSNKFKSRAGPFAKCSSSCSNIGDGDIFYDIPLENCTKETKQLIEGLINDGGFNEFARNVDQYLSNSEKYVTLLSMLDDSKLDDTGKFELLKSLISSRDEKKDTKSVEIAGSAVLVTKKRELPSEGISLTLKNDSQDTIVGGDLKFSFVDTGSEESVVVKNSSTIYPSQQRSYNVKLTADKLADLEGRSLEITSEGSPISLKGTYSQYEPSVLRIYGQVPSSPKASSHVTPKEEVFNHSEDEVSVTLVPKSPTLAQIVIANRSQKEIDCSDLRLEIVNCFGNTISKVIVHKSQGVLPFRVGKFNIPLSNSHIKFPYKVVLINDHFKANAELSKNNSTGRLIFTSKASSSEELQENEAVKVNSDEGSSETDDEMENLENEQVPEKPDSAPMNSSLSQQNESNSGSVQSVNNEATSENPGVTSMNSSYSQQNESTSGSVHSIVLPSLPREASASEISTVEETHEDVPNENDESEDYDLVSIEGEGSDESEGESDFEILSPVSSGNEA